MEPIPTQRRSLLPDLAIFVGGGILLFGVVKLGVPRLAAMGMDPFAAWMILSAGFVFIPIGLAAFALLRSEGVRAPGRLRFERPSRAAWKWAALGAVVMMGGSFGISVLVERLGLSVSPFVRAPTPWAAWMLPVWLVYWPLNILGEELAWRGVILPRMESRLGSWAWCLNAAFWGVFHTGFGLGNVLVLSPTLLVVPWVAQRARNSWVAVFLHAFISLPGMALIALGKL